MRGYDAWKLQSPPWDEHEPDCPCHPDNGSDDPADCRCNELEEAARDEAAEDELNRMKEERR